MMHATRGALPRLLMPRGYASSLEAHGVRGRGKLAEVSLSGS